MTGDVILLATRSEGKLRELRPLFAAAGLQVQDLRVAGIPHGPHPGAMERSIGKKETDELAVMVDTFKPLQVTEEAMKIDDGTYYKSWIE